MSVTRVFIFSIIAILLSYDTVIAFKNLHLEEGDICTNEGTNFPPRYLSGSIHYFRVHPSDWGDRLKKLRWSGCNAVQTYIEWSSHEPEPGVFDFSGGLDLERFMRDAQEAGLMVILRAGPYICAERDMGGLPYWLLRLHPNIHLRTSDPYFRKYVKRWYEELLPRLHPYMAERGGPVIMVQVENEYSGNSVSDLMYLTWMSNLFREGLGNKTFLFSTDNGDSGHLQRAKIPGVYATVDFGVDKSPKDEFISQRLFEPIGPLINSEFYPGWMDHWGHPHSTIPSQVFAKTLHKILELGASVNIYMFHGGTSFGFGAGSNEDKTFLSCPTSYDYDAPLTEAGDPTDKFYAVRNVAKKFFFVPSGPSPTVTPKYAYGSIRMKPLAEAFTMLPMLNHTDNLHPPTFEELSVKGGIVAYQTTLRKTLTDPCILRVESHDVGYVYVDRKFAGMTSRSDKFNEVLLFGRPGQILTIFVQSLGRISVGAHLKDFKGIISSPTLNGHVLENWKMIPLPLEDPSRVLEDFEGVSTSREEAGRMTFYKGVFKVPLERTHPRNTFLRLDGWRKGYAWINGFLLGLYWPVMGPQVTLYVPHGILKQGENQLLLFELEKSPCDLQVRCTVTLTDAPDINGPVPPNH